MKAIISAFGIEQVVNMPVYVDTIMVDVYDEYKAIRQPSEQINKLIFNKYQYTAVYKHLGQFDAMETPIYKLVVTVKANTEG